MAKAKIKNDAKVKKDGSIVLTTGLHQSGEAILLKKIDICSKPWVMNAVVSMGNNKGISDEDGQGGDGIWFKFNGESLVVGLDTFMNESNKSGNEIVIKSEGEIVAQQTCPIRLNSGKKVNVKIFCVPKKQSMLAVMINNKVVLNYAFKASSIPYIFKNKPAEFSMYSFTGDAGSTQIVHSVDYKYVNENLIDSLKKEIQD